MSKTKPSVIEQLDAAIRRFSSPAPKQTRAEVRLAVAQRQAHTILKQRLDRAIEREKINQDVIQKLHDSIHENMTLKELLATLKKMYSLTEGDFHLALQLFREDLINLPQIQPERNERAS